jgi:hypothetical protein
VAVAAALAYNRRVWRPRQARTRQPFGGLGSNEVTRPLAALAVLLPVFVLVQTFGSWATAGRAETDEATATLLLFREADLVRSPALRDRLHREVICYATSVVRQEWPAMADNRVRSVPTYWAARIRGSGVDLVRAGGRDLEAGKELVARDGQRAAARQNRLGEARPTLPTALTWLMLAALSITLAVIGVVTAADVASGAHRVIVVLTAVVFVTALILISDLDQPYRGALKRSPKQTEFVRAQMAAEMRGPLPCDDAGLPLRAPGFRARTDPLG